MRGEERREGGGSRRWRLLGFLFLPLPWKHRWLQLYKVIACLEHEIPLWKDKVENAHTFPSPPPPQQKKNGAIFNPFDRPKESGYIMARSLPREHS